MQLLRADLKNGEIGTCMYIVYGVCRLIGEPIMASYRLLQLSTLYL